MPGNLDHKLVKALQKTWREIGGPTALGLYLCAEYGDWESVLTHTAPDPRLFNDARKYREAAYAVGLTRKLRLPTETKRLAEEARRTFFACEAMCKATNIRLSRYLQHGPFDHTQLRVFDFIGRWRKVLRRVLGKAPLALTPRFSGGSTLSDQGSRTTVPDKMDSRPTLYHNTAEQWALSSSWTPFHRKMAEYVRGNRFFTVPKDSFKDRGCCVEASTAVALQLDVGAQLKKKVSLYQKVDLVRTPDLHRVLARQASIDGSLATIDLSNASDTVAKSLVKLLLPPDWYALLASLRATSTLIDDKVVHLEKFSSMGNGFTFELETLLFSTLCEACGATFWSCFGDDIIVNIEAAHDVIAALQYFGFEPNKKKTFCESSFRESCGGDFFNGVSVRPHFLKEIPDAPQKWISLHNGLKKIGCTAAARFCKDQVPSDIARCVGPDWLGDIVFNDDDVEPIQVGGVPSYRCYTPVSRGRLLSKWPGLIPVWASCMGVPSRVVPRDNICGYKKTWVPAFAPSELVNRINRLVGVR